jgi:hypothetical protein
MNEPDILRAAAVIVGQYGDNKGSSGSLRYNHVVSTERQLVLRGETVARQILLNLCCLDEESYRASAD